MECECELYYDDEEDEEEIMDCECGAEEPYDHDMHQYPDSFEVTKEELVGQVITDLWAIMVADYSMMEAEMKKRGFDIEEELRNNPSLFMVEMEEGDYEFKNYYEVYDGDGYDAQVYATLFKV